MLGTDSESMAWHKASYSGSGEHCVELGYSTAACAVRDSKLGAHSPLLRLTPGGHDALTTHLRGARWGTMST